MREIFREPEQGDGKQAESAKMMPEERSEDDVLYDMAENFLKQKQMDRGDIALAGALRATKKLPEQMARPAVIQLMKNKRDLDLRIQKRAEENQRSQNEIKQLEKERPALEKRAKEANETVAGYMRNVGLDKINKKFLNK
jgi:hypothetical protein